MAPQTEDKTKLEGIKEVNIPEQKYFDGVPFPLVLSPSVDLQGIVDWCTWIENHRDDMKKLLLKYGAILFRGFPIRKPEDFDLFAKSFGYEIFPYIGGAAPRRLVTGNAFTSSESPSEAVIPFHHEMGQVPIFPKVIYFYCDVPPASGGQTPIVLSHEVYKAMKIKEPEFVERLDKEGVHYLRILSDGDDPDSAIGRGWQQTFLTEDKAEAEERAREQGLEFEWMPDGCMRTLSRMKAFRVDERTGKKMWHNSINGAYQGWQDKRNDRNKAATFPNGDQMPPKVMDTLTATLNSLAVDAIWEQGDVIMIDNRQALHGRRPFIPPRRILASLFKE